MPKINAANVAQHREQTWAALLDAVSQLVAERGFESLSMREIAQRAGVTRTVIYNYAPDKETLLIATAQRGGDQLDAKIRAVSADNDLSRADRIRAILRILLVDFRSDPTALLMMSSLFGSLGPSQSEEAVRQLRERAAVTLSQLLNDPTDTGSSADQLDATLAVRLTAAVVESCVRAMSEDHTHADWIADQCTLYVLRALGVED